MARLFAKDRAVVKPLDFRWLALRRIFREE